MLNTTIEKRERENLREVGSYFISSILVVLLHKKLSQTCSLKQHTGVRSLVWVCWVLWPRPWCLTRIDAFELWCWRRLLRVPRTARRSNQSILKEISLEHSLEGLMLKLKLQYFVHLMWRTELIWKDPDAGKDGRWEEKGSTEDEMVGWHHQLNGHEFEQTQEDGEGRGSLVCCSPWGRKELDMTEWLNWTDFLSLDFATDIPL